MKIRTTKMSLKEFKKEVEANLLRMCDDTTRVEQIMNSDADWKRYRKDFSPEVTAQGLLSGLI